MINKKIILIPTLLLMVLIYSCSDSPSSVGENLLSPDFLAVNTINSYQDSLSQTSSYYKTQIRLSDSPRLLVGKFENVDEAFSLIRFAVVLPDTIKSALFSSSLNIIDAKVKLTREYSIGDVNSSFNYSVYFIKSGWTSYGFNADSSLDYDLTPIESNKTYSDSILTFNLDESTIIKWFYAVSSDTSIYKNYGIFLKPDAASTGIIGFDAFNVNLIGIPVLDVIVATGGITDTLNFYSIEDVSAISGDKPAMPPGDIAVQGALAVNARVKFDLSSIPKGSIINKAQLTLFVDSSATITGTPFSNSVIAYFATDSAANTYDTTSAVVLDRADNYFNGDIAPFIQSIISGYHKNNGFILAEGGQNLGVDIFALKGSDALDLSLRPRLVITYTGRK